MEMGEELDWADREAESHEVPIMDTQTLIRGYEFCFHSKAYGVPACEVALPMKPPALICVKEAHLYLSPIVKLCTGNHSEVYNAELELLRDLFVELVLCMECVVEELAKEKHRPKKSGRWQSLLVQEGMHIPKGESSDDDTSDVDEGYEMPVPPHPNKEFDHKEITILAPSSNGPGSSKADGDDLVVFCIYCPGI
ncbi:hypothetical protein SCLCIDRAFT_28504 [Scleroderma citrinum Foug A]|uniref:Uncharacterized protein n=1 Tax=Scleroderma citrinum Foug A TaxID=1036808 RepID=A0A0C3DPF0_9AGAM|nr:hypothetical protein SCLCIDRAFT_28504 [Scleroderma citrinum Foug A]